MGLSQSELRKLDEQIPAYVRGVADQETRNRIEQQIKVNEDFAKQVQVEQSLLASIARQTSGSHESSTSFESLRQRIENENIKVTATLPKRAYYMPALAAAVVLAVIALPLLLEPSVNSGNEFEALSAPQLNSSQPTVLGAQPGAVRIIFKSELSEREREVIAARYGLGVHVVAGALNSIIYKVPEQENAEQILEQLQRDEGIEFAALTGSME
ncbi:MAG: hypothetical protein AB8B86_12255 [Pseudomonadales bacterium]